MGKAILLTSVLIFWQVQSFAMDFGIGIEGDSVVDSDGSGSVVGSVGDLDGAMDFGGTSSSGDSSGGSDGSSGGIGGGEADAAGVVSSDNISVEPTREPGDMLRSPDRSFTEVDVAVTVGRMAVTETGKTISRSNFNGKFFEEVVDTSVFNIHPNSENIINQLLTQLKQSQILDPIARLGLKGVRFVVIEGLKGSFYAIEHDVIFLAIDDINNYGVVPLHHELMHAGLRKARRSGTISKDLYLKLTHLNKTHFSHFNGYVGTSQGYYGQNGYGVQEAAVIGMTLVKIRDKRGTMSNSNLVDKAKKYLDDVLDNKFLTRTPDGKVIRYIKTGTISRMEVRDQFLNRFSSGSSQITSWINQVQSNIKTAMPNLCEPGTIRVNDVLSCNHNEYIYSKKEALVYQQCGDNLKYGPEIVESCGTVIGYKGP